jgi:ribosomal protein S18 acetylase RimI-like enzyme
VRPATRDDLPHLLDLAVELREHVLPAGEPRERGRGAGARAALEGRYAEALDDPDRHLVVATDEDGATLGMALFTVATTNALLDTAAVHMSHAVVSGRYRRRGAGKALVAAVAAFAEERGLDQIVVSVPPTSRDANRFFARLGFAPLAVRRVAPVALVRRHLPVDGRVGDAAVRRRARRPGRLLGGPVLPLGAAFEEPPPPSPAS